MTTTANAHMLENRTTYKRNNVADLLPNRKGFIATPVHSQRDVHGKSVTVPARKPAPITPDALARFHRLISIFPNYGGYPNKQPAHNQSERQDRVKEPGRGDLNARPPAPKAGALPGCATPRLIRL